jgi:hypothetical protein
VATEAAQQYLAWLLGRHTELLDTSTGDIGH